MPKANSYSPKAKIIMLENFLLFITPFRPKFSFKVIKNSNNLSAITIAAIFFLTALKIFCDFWLNKNYISNLTELKTIVYLGGLSFGIILRVVVLGILVVNIINRIFNIPIDYGKGMAIVSISSLPLVVIPAILYYFHWNNFLFMGNVLSSMLISFGITYIFNLDSKRMLGLTAAILILIYFVKVLLYGIQTL